MPVVSTAVRFILSACVVLLLAIPQACAQAQILTASDLAQLQQYFSQTLSPRVYQDFLTIVSQNQSAGRSMDSASLYLQMSQVIANLTKKAKKTNNQMQLSMLQQDQKVIQAALPAPNAPGSNGVNTTSGTPYNPSAQARPGQLRNGLPPTMFDSFVAEAGSQAELIYGDEGEKRPPFMGFTYQHRIDAGISGRRDQGLTTGHGSYLPDAWGADEFIAPPGEWSQSGANGGQLAWNNPGLPGAMPINPVDPIDPTVATYDPNNPYTDPSGTGISDPGPSYTGPKYDISSSTSATMGTQPATSTSGF